MKDILWPRHGVWKLVRETGIDLFEIKSSAYDHQNDWRGAHPPLTRPSPGAQLIHCMLVYMKYVNKNRCNRQEDSFSVAVFFFPGFPKNHYNTKQVTEFSSRKSFQGKIWKTKTADGWLLSTEYWRKTLVENGHCFCWPDDSIEFEGQDRKFSESPPNPCEKRIWRPIGKKNKEIRNCLVLVLYC